MQFIVTFLIVRICYLPSALVPYSRKPVTQFSPPQSVWIKKNPYALRGIKNKKSGE
jgi:hypothetical protein